MCNRITVVIVAALLGCMVLAGCGGGSISSTASSTSTSSSSSSSTSSSTPSSSSSAAGEKAREEAAAGFAERLKAINADKAADRRMGGTTQEMIEAGSDYVMRYEALMNDVFNYVAKLGDVDKASLEASQSAWRGDYDQIPQRAQQETGGGSLTGPYILDDEMHSLESRIRELIGMVSPAVAQSLPADQEAQSAPAQQPVSTAVEPVVVNTPYYTITIPGDWPDGAAGGTTYEVDEELRHPSPELGMGCTTTVHVGTGSFEVSCFTDNWGAQGNYVAENLGAPSNLPGWHVVVYTSRDTSGSQGKRNLSGDFDDIKSFVKLA